MKQFYFQHVGVKYVTLFKMTYELKKQHVKQIIIVVPLTHNMKHLVHNCCALLLYK